MGLRVHPVRYLIAAALIALAVAIWNEAGHVEYGTGAHMSR